MRALPLSLPLVALLLATACIDEDALRERRAVLEASARSVQREIDDGTARDAASFLADRERTAKRALSVDRDALRENVPAGVTVFGGELVIEGPAPLLLATLNALEAHAPLAYLQSVTRNGLRFEISCTDWHGPARGGYRGPLPPILGRVPPWSRALVDDVDRLEARLSALDVQYRALSGLTLEDREAMKHVHDDLVAENRARRDNPVSVTRAAPWLRLVLPHLRGAFVLEAAEPGGFRLELARCTALRDVAAPLALLEGNRCFYEVRETPSSKNEP